MLQCIVSSNCLGTIKIKKNLTCLKLLQQYCFHFTLFYLDKTAECTIHSPLMCCIFDNITPRYCALPEWNYK